jgi:hypothetical protein
MDRRMYGAPLSPLPLTCAPINENGVIFLFGAVARELGFAASSIQGGFPDCEALRQVEKDRWQKVRIEIEYESRNFCVHRHNPKNCDLIVCWKHNWEECPLEVIELKKVVGGGS